MLHCVHQLDAKDKEKCKFRCFINSGPGYQSHGNFYITLDDRYVAAHQLLQHTKLWMFTSIATPFFCQIRWHHTPIGALIGGRQGFLGDHSVYPRNSGGRAAVTGMWYCAPADCCLVLCDCVYSAERTQLTGSNHWFIVTALNQGGRKKKSSIQSPLFRAEEKSFGFWLCVAEALNHRCRVKEVRKLTRAL